MDEVYSNVQSFEDGKPDLSLRYVYHPHENAEEEGLPDPYIEDGELLSEGQLFYLATGYALPRNQAPSSRLKEWFKEQGVAEERAEGLALGAWFAAHMDELRMRRPTFFSFTDNFGDFLSSLDNELAEMAEKIESETVKAVFWRQKRFQNSLCTLYLKLLAGSLSAPQPLFLFVFPRDVSYSSKMLLQS